MPTKNKARSNGLMEGEEPIDWVASAIVILPSQDK